MKILIIGAGNMGKTYAKSLLSNYFTQPENLFLLDVKPVDEPYLKDVPKANISTSANENISQADIILLAVKPQDFDALFPSIAPFLHSEQIALSIMAGVTMHKLSESLHLPKIVRAMPNLPAQIGMGMAVFTCTSALDKKELFIIQNLLNATGKSIYVEDEKLIDAATAISGSGPAYVYYFMQAMIDKAEEMGFSKSEAELMVNQTFMGAVHLHNQFDFTCNEWIARVASKGGTTEAALKSFNEHDLHHHIGRGLQSALVRANELGKIKK
jgi:pyrroline-5-carboxylate reductase